MRLRGRLAWRIAGTVLLAIALAWAVGLLWFIQLASHRYPPPPDADGIVALTGGADRVETALRLLQAHKAHWLLLSGIGGGAALPVLAHRADVNPQPLAEQVKLGRRATSTRGNAMETAAWARQHDIHSLIVVTAFYHMPRALTELRRALPDVTLYPDPVLTPAQGTIGRVVTLRLVAVEYTKYLVALTGITSLLPNNETPRAAAAHSA